MTISHPHSLTGAAGEAVELSSQKMTYAAAIRQVLQEEMRRDPRVFLMGEDIGIYGRSVYAIPLSPSRPSPVVQSGRR